MPIRNSMYIRNSDAFTTLYANQRDYAGRLSKDCYAKEYIPAYHLCNFLRRGDCLLKEITSIGNPMTSFSGPDQLADWMYKEVASRKCFRNFTVINEKGLHSTFTMSYYWGALFVAPAVQPLPYFSDRFKSEMIGTYVVNRRKVKSFLENNNMNKHTSYFPTEFFEFWISKRRCKHFLPDGEVAFIEEAMKSLRKTQKVFDKDISELFTPISPSQSLKVCPKALLESVILDLQLGRSRAVNAMIHDAYS